ncbi:MAG TPA: hypothetical protein PLI57_00910 [Spirochaetota bacterium]|nr:hypothetical protein [Spirochaetota bacterium]
MENFLTTIKIAITVMGIAVFSGCFYDSGEVNLLTDDVILYDAVEKYNKTFHERRVNVLYFNDKSGNIFKTYNANDLKNVDIIAGSYYADVPINSKKYKKIDKEIIDNKNFSNLVKSYIANSRYLSIPYSSDFFVLKAIPSVEFDNTPNSLNINEFIEINKKNSVFDENTNSYVTLSYSPLGSITDGLDYLFILNAKLKKENGYYSFNGQAENFAYNFYFKYDDLYNKGIDITKKYFDYYKNVDKNFYVKKRIMNYDFIGLSKALSYGKDYKIVFIEDQQFGSLKKKVVAVSKNSFTSRKSLLFIDYLLGFETQKFLYETTLKHREFYEYVHIPIYAEIFDATNDSIESKTSEYIKRELTKLVEPYFYSSKIQERFFQGYYYAVDAFSKGQVGEKDFLKFLTNEINK